MIIWVKGEAVDMPCDQRAKVQTVGEEDTTIVITLLGTGKTAMIQPTDVVGMEFPGDKKVLSIFFKTGVTRYSHYSY